MPFFNPGHNTDGHSLPGQLFLLHHEIILPLIDIVIVCSFTEVVVPDDTDGDRDLDEAPNERIHREQNGIVNVGKCCI